MHDLITQTFYFRHRKLLSCVIWSLIEFRDVLKSTIIRNYSSNFLPSLLPSGTYNQNTHLYNINTLQYVQVLTGHVGIINDLCASPSGNFLFTASYDCAVQVSHEYDFSVIKEASLIDRSSLILSMIVPCH